MLELSKATGMLGEVNAAFKHLASQAYRAANFAELLQMRNIKHNYNGWELIEFARQMPSGNNPEVIERFYYERFNKNEEVIDRAVGFRVEGREDIIFDRDFA